MPSHTENGVTGRLARRSLTVRKEESDFSFSTHDAIASMDSILLFVGTVQRSNTIQNRVARLFKSEGMGSDLSGLVSFATLVLVGPINSRHC